jgi:hypothetical protein
MIYVVALAILTVVFLFGPALLDFEGWSPMQHLLSKMAGLLILLMILPSVILSRVLQFETSRGY